MTRDREHIAAAGTLAERRALIAALIGWALFALNKYLGIKTEDINRIFDRFVQADEVLTKSYGGTGLGLAIAKEMAETIGAELSVSSVPGSGSCFALILPGSALVT